MRKPIRCVILDRDGVINEDSDAFIKSPDEWIPIPGSIEAIAELSKAKIPVFIATNQSGVARGYFDLAMLTSIHEKMLSWIEKAGGHIEAIVFCPHGPDDGCNCRKPKPGLILDCLQQTLIPASETLVIGDSLRDLEAGEAAGCQTCLVLTGKGLKTLGKTPELRQTSLIFDNLEAAVIELISTG